ncbi:hypothetical protein EG328_004115 [Venturia inaequalis]|uniref:Uncharacterized protein n=1 Tax=Venturia inaequalis TaxID=5025 RepID=A0A8H3VG09_VENIN|nr:hypothetical protein EG328_004115 [Venturia inaequalis]
MDEAQFVAQFPDLKAGLRRMKEFEDLDLVPPTDDCLGCGPGPKTEKKCSYDSAASVHSHPNEALLLPIKLAQVLPDLESLIGPLNNELGEGDYNAPNLEALLPKTLLPKLTGSLHMTKDYQQEYRTTWARLHPQTKIYEEPGVQSSVELALKMGKEQDGMCVLVTGSQQLVGNVLSLLRTE